jgi:co-chaperonin GroES (HSP10)
MATLAASIKSAAPRDAKASTEKSRNATFSNAGQQSSGAFKWLAQTSDTIVTAQKNSVANRGFFGSLMPVGPVITATKVDAIAETIADGGNNDGNLDPGEKINYTVTITDGSVDATGVIFNDTVHPHTSYVNNSLNASPLANNDAYETVGNTLLEVGPVTSPSARPKITVTGNVLTNDTDFLGDAAPTVTTTTTTSTAGGTVSMDAAGHFSFTPKEGFTGDDTFTYTITDDGADNAPGGGDDLTSTATVTITVKAPRIWYVDNTVAVTGLGRSTDPFKTLLEADTAANAAGDIVYVFTGSGNTGQNVGFTFAANSQQLLGEGVPLQPTVTVNGVVNPLLRAAGAKPSIGNAAGNGVTVGNFSGIVIRGLTIVGSTNGIAATFSTVGNGVTINTNTLSGTSANAIDVTTTVTTGGGAAVAISNNTISGAGAEGIDINGQGTGGIILALDSQTITSSGSGIDINGTSGGVTITSFANNVISGSSGANGVLIQTATFDSNPGLGGLQALTPGTLSIGSSGAGNGVGGNGLVMFGTLTGTLPFTTLNIFADGGRGIDVTGSGVATTGLTASSGATISATNGAAVSFTGGTTIDLQNALITSTNSPDSGVNLSNVNGTFSAVASSSITNAAGDDFVVGSGTANITWNAPLSNSGAGNSIDVTGHTGGTVAFTGAVNDTGQGIFLNSNTGTTINFTGGVTASTGTFAAFTATSGGTVNVCDENVCNPNATGSLVNTLTTTTGIALNVANTTIGSNKLEFKSISAGTGASGPTSGIILNNTGNSGSLIVKGDGNTSLGGNNSGGVIQRATQYGISLTNTNSPSFTNMNIHDIARNGIDGFGVTNFTFANGNVATTGTASLAGDYEVNSIAFVDRAGANDNTISGTVSITGSTITDPERNAIIIETWAGTIDSLTISNNTLSGGTTNARIQNAIQVFSQGSATGTGNITTGSIQNNNISDFRFFDTAPAIDVWIGGNGIRVVGGNPNAASTSATLGTVANPFVINGNDIDNVGSNMIAVTFAGKQGLSNFTIQNNGTNADKMTNAEGNGISVFFGGNGTFNALVDNNYIDNIDQGGNPSGSKGIAVQSDFGLVQNSDVTNSNITVSNNRVSNTSGDGIQATGINNAGTFNVRIINNAVTTVPDLDARYGIRVQQSNVGTQPTLNLEMNGNTTVGAFNAFHVLGSGMAVRKQDPYQFGIEGLSPSPTNSPEAYINSQNPGGAGTDKLAGTGFIAQNVALYKPENNQTEYTARGDSHLQNSNPNSFFSVLSISAEFASTLVNIIQTAKPVSAEIAAVNAKTAPQPLARGKFFDATLALMKQGSQATSSTVNQTNSESFEIRDNSVALAHASSRPAKRDLRVVKDRSKAMQLSHAPKTRTRANASAAFMPSGDPLTAVNIGTLKVGQSVTIKFQVTLDNPPNLDAADLVGGPHVRNQGTVSGSNFSNVLTDDTAVGGSADPTDTPVDLYNVNVSVVTSKPGPTFMVEGESVTFTATVTPAPSQPVGVPGAATGSVTFYDGAAIPANVITGCSNLPLSGTTAACTTTALTNAGSPHTITAQYNGDGNFDINTGTVSQTVNSCTSNPVVTTTADSGVGSLRQALFIACVGSTITFDAAVFATPQTITLTSGELLITKNLTIDGPNAATSRVTITGGSSSRAFNIQPGKTVTLRDLTVSGSTASGVSPANLGGAIYNDHAVVNLVNMAISGNTADSGGGVYNNGTTSGSATLTIINSTLSGNTAAASGGAVFNDGANGSATLNLINSTISGNNAAANGGGVFSNGNSGSAAVTTTNATVTNNHSDSDDTSGGDGGGLYLAVGTYRLRNTIVAGNFKGSGTTTADDIFGTVDAANSFNNLIGTGGAGGLSNAVQGNQVGVSNLFIGPLASNGGLTQTHALLFGSPAIEAGDNTKLTTDTFDLDGDANVAETLPVDQRGLGFARTADSADAGTTQTVDIGAFEVQPTIGDIPDKTDGLEDVSIVSYPFSVGDATIGVDSITTNVTSDPSGVVQSVTVNNPTTATPSLNITYVANKFGVATISVTVNKTINSQLLTMTDSFVLTVSPVADVPSVTNATTNEDTQTTTGLVITKNAADGAEVTHFKITNITGGTLFKNDGVTQINNNDFITVAEGFGDGTTGLKFTPAANSSVNGQFQVQGAVGNTGSGLSSAATATITVNTVADTPSVSPATTNEDTQTSSGLVITRNANDGIEVTHFKITGITNGTLFQNNGTTQINNGDFITFAQGNAGLKFTPAANFSGNGQFTIQASTTNADGGLGGSTVNATITVTPVADTPTVTSTTTTEDVQTTSGLVITKNVVDGAEVTHFKITNIQNGTLYKNDGVTQINNNDFITVAEGFGNGTTGLKFTPATNFSGAGIFQVQGATNGSGAGLSVGLATATITVGSTADVPTVTNSTTNEDTQTTNGLVITRNASDGAEITHFKITNIQNGTLFKNDGVTQITSGSFITAAEGNAGLKFTPAANFSGNGSFQVQAALDNSGTGLSTFATATITVTPIADTPTVSNATTAINTQTTSGLVIDRNSVDGPEVTHFKITGITNGTLYKNDGTTQINNGDFITFAEGNAGLRFTPDLNKSTSNGDVFSFQVQAATDGAGAGLSAGSATATITVACQSGLVVTSLLDDGSVGTLRHAISFSCPGSTITFNLGAGPHTIALTAGQLLINKNLTITGSDSTSPVTISGGSSSRVFNISAGSFNVQLSNLTISGGLVTGDGAGLLNNGTGTVTITNSTFTGNAATNGGAIASIAGTVNIYNTTISGNTVTADGGGLYHNTAGTVNVLNSTIYNNHADTGQGGGIASPGGTTNVKNSIVAGNTAASNANGSGTIVDQGNNILTGDPKVAALANNGGPTQTHALLPGSPALDAGDNTASDGVGLTTDQRGTGFGRKRDAASDADTTQTVDIGAFEADPSVEDITDKATTEDTALPTFTFKVGDSASSFTSITATSSNTTLVPNANIIVGSDTPSTRTLSITPAADQSGTATITVTVTKTIGGNAVSMSDTFVLNVGTVLDTPSVTSTSTNEDTQSTSGLVITKNVVDDGEVTHFKITNITGGTLFKNNGTTVINNNDFITEAEGNAGLKFTPAGNSFGAGSFQVQSSTDNVGTILSAGLATATITINAVADTPNVTNATTNEDTQTSSGLVITRNVSDGAEVTHFKITGITGGALFKNNGTTPINNGDFITFAEGSAGLKFTPAANSFAGGQFQVQAATSATGDGLSTGSATATITVNAVADTPNVTPATTNEDTQTTSGLVITRNAVDGAEVTHFKITNITGGTLFQNNGTTQINNNDFITVAQGNAGLKFTPAANSFANGSFQVQGATDNTGSGLGSAATATITVNAIADTPSVTNATTNEDTQTSSGLVISRNASDGAEVTHFKVTGITNGTLYKNDGTTQINNGDFITFAEGSAGLKFTPAANLFSPSTTFSFQVQAATSAAGAGLSAGFATATITVNTVADTPSVTNATTLEDQQTTSGLVISRNPADGVEVTHFKITGITNGTLFQNNGTTVINNNDFITVAQGNAGLKFTPAANFSGSGQFQAQSSLNNTNAGLGGNLATATITVTPVNDAPTLDALGNLIINEDAPQQTVNLTNISAGGGESQTLSITATSDNTGLIPNPTVNYTSPNTTGTLTFTPVLNQSGSALITVTVNDGGGTANGGAETIVRTFTVTVNAVNDAPVNTIPGTQNAIRNTSFTFSAANSNPISIADVDAGAAVVQVTLTATNGKMTLASTAGLTFTPANANNDGTNDATLVFTGTITNINNALNGLVFDPTPGFDGLATIQITTNDLGNTGSGGAQSDTDTININVNKGGFFAFSSATYSVAESGGTVTITVERLGGSFGTTKVDYTTSNGTAVAGQDYTTSSGQLTFNSGETTKTFTVSISEDVLDEANETVNLTLSNAQGSGELGSPATAVLTINDNDPTPSLSINDVSVTEGNSATVNATFTVTLSAISGQNVTVNYQTADGTATAPSDYTAIPSTALTFLPGETTKTITVLVKGDTDAEANENFFVNLSGAVNATLADNQGQGTITSDDTPLIGLSSSTYSVTEDGLHATLTVNRLGDLSQPARVDYLTSDPSGLNNCSQFTGNASSRCDYATTAGTLRFAAGETSKTIFVPIIDDVYLDGPEVFTLTLSNSVGGDLSGINAATITIIDNDTAPAANPIDNDAFFIRQLYIDFLGREPEGGAVNAWLGILNHCAIPTDCDRIAVAHGFVRSAEFQERGFFVYRTFKTLGRIAHYNEFIPDMARVSGFLSAQDLEANKQAYIEMFMERQEFKNLYDPTIGNPTAYVDKLLQSVELTNHPSRAGWIAGLTNGTLTRAQVLRQLIDSGELYTLYVNEAFIIMNYFGFLRRDADASYRTWIDIFNHTNDDRVIINGFLNSLEYRLRFGPN